MKVIDDGVIKYDRTNFSYLETISEQEFAEIEYQRKKLYQLNLIGVEPISNIGFGNISAKYNFQNVHQTTNPQFVITGTQTGKYPELDGKLYTRVIDFDINELKLFSMGAVEASSEALTHAAIYLGNPKIQGIVHVHSTAIWEGIIREKKNSTRADIPYGSKEMALESMNMVRNNPVGFFAMEGHDDGVVTYAESIQAATDIIINLYHQYN
jgi:hypothetical protein